MKKTFIVIGIIAFIVISFNINVSYQKRQRRLAVENLYKTFPSRIEASKHFKKWIIPALKDVGYQVYFPNLLRIEELAIVLNILFITETSAKEKDGNWYVAHSDLFALNSLFGVKNKNGVSKNTWEEINGEIIKISDGFAYYNDIDECLRYWLKFISTDRYKLVRESSNWSEIVLQLKAAGYMTDSQYPNKATQIYNTTLKDLYK